MPAPLIGLTTGVQEDSEGYRKQRLNDNYVQAVIAAGGIPVLIPTGLPETSYDDLLARLDGILFTGGPDIDPVIFHGKPHASVYGIDAERDSLELGLARRAADAKKPFLGICRGIQVINVALGGNLYTDIADQVPNALKHDTDGAVRDYRAHPVTVEEGSLLAGIVRAGAVRVNSFHHQAVKDVAPRLRLVATSPDHVVEAVELPDHPFGLGVQWHPEGMIEDPQMLSIFRRLVAASAQ
ncbi:MAG TPA: gamma-glutamyl-gamma-aminobutyrate hydrolase family protein [Anaerolineaceae bacterium]